jgi:hypothetical protein
MNNTPSQFKAKQMDELSSSKADGTITLPITEYEQLVNIQEELRIQKEINKSLADTVTVLEMEIIKLIDKQAAQAMKDK